MNRIRADEQEYMWKKKSEGLIFREVIGVTIGDYTTSYLLPISYFWVVYVCLPLFVANAHYVMCAQCLSLFL